MSQNRQGVLFISKIDPWYLGGYLILWLSFYSIKPNLDHARIAPVFLSFLMFFYVLQGCRYSFENDALFKYYIHRRFAWRIPYDSIDTLEFRDRSGPFERPTLVIHFKNKTVGKNWHPFRFFYTSLNSMDKLKEIAIAKNVKWYVSV
jgi:hypothetical protein